MNTYQKFMASRERALAEAEPATERKVTVELYADRTWHVNHGGPGITESEAKRAMVAIAAACLGVEPDWMDSERCGAVLSAMKQGKRPDAAKGG